MCIREYVTPDTKGGGSQRTRKIGERKGENHAERGKTEAEKGVGGRIGRQEGEKVTKALNLGKKETKNWKRKKREWRTEIKL